MQFRHFSKLLHVKRPIFQTRANNLYEIGVAGARDATAITGSGSSNGSQRESCTEVGIRIKASVWYVISSMFLCRTPSS